MVAPAPRPTATAGADPGNVITATLSSNQHKGVAHPAAMPEALARFCVSAFSPAGGVVIDPFAGSGTTALVARGLGRWGAGIELHREFVEEARVRLEDT